MSNETKTPGSNNSDFVIVTPSVTQMQTVEYQYKKFISSIITKIP
jgi:hypothetical protein